MTLSGDVLLAKACSVDGLLSISTVAFRYSSAILYDDLFTGDKFFDVVLPVLVAWCIRLTASR